MGDLLPSPAVGGDRIEARESGEIEATGGKLLVVAHRAGPEGGLHCFLKGAGSGRVRGRCRLRQFRGVHGHESRYG
ncbi:MAG: hypothetical protein EHM80_15495 [Nitrospiraceae bacterium]|nr:MAG: hypothetical protein EHM80_15495 [Nitrospiraceae bacterium]